MNEHGGCCDKLTEQNTMPILCGSIDKCDSKT